MPVVLWIFSIVEWACFTDSKVVLREQQFAIWKVKMHMIDRRIHDTSVYVESLFTWRFVLHVHNLVVLIWCESAWIKATTQVAKRLRHRVFLVNEWRTKFFCFLHAVS